MIPQSSMRQLLRGILSVFLKELRNYLEPRPAILATDKREARFEIVSKGRSQRGRHGALGACSRGGAMAYTVTLIPGDGTGPEIMKATRQVLEATGVQFNWDVQAAGLEVMQKEGTPLPDHVLQSIKRNKVAIKGPITTPVGKVFRSVNVALRTALD